MPFNRTFHYQWTWELQSAPEALWPFLANTNRMNKDMGLGTLTPLMPSDEKELQQPMGQTVRLIHMGMPIEWDESPFEWVAPHHFSVSRHYRKGPVAQMRTLCQLTPRPQGGATITFDITLEAANLLGSLAIPIQMGKVFHRDLERTLHQYDQLAKAPQVEHFRDMAPHAKKLAPHSFARLQEMIKTLKPQVKTPELLAKLTDLVMSGEETLLRRLRAYALADAWGADRKAVLELCLHAAATGILDAQWDLLCPLCRGAKASYQRLQDVETSVHCDACQIDFTVRFDQSVELTFMPNPTLRPIEMQEYCIGSPQRTPHIVSQMILQPGETKAFDISLAKGRYRVRSHRNKNGKILEASSQNTTANCQLAITDSGWIRGEDYLALQSHIEFCNENDSPELMILEYLPWNAQSTTAAEVSTVQAFRDLFGTQALRQNEHVAIRSLTVVFTDLCDSAKFYREVGDAAAFGTVMQHFDVLKQTLTEEGGAIVKTLGDAVMVVFHRPVLAIRALQKAQQMMGDTEALKHLKLKAGVHMGSCIAVTQNDRLDYFGSNVNLAARLVALCKGNGIVLSSAVMEDPEVKQYLLATPNLTLEEMGALQIKGFDNEMIHTWYLR